MAPDAPTSGTAEFIENSEKASVAATPVAMYQNRNGSRPRRYSTLSP